MSDISDEMVEAYRAAANEWLCDCKNCAGMIRDGLAAAYPLLRAQVREEVARDIEAAPDAVLPPSAVDRSRVAAIARGVAADGACSRGGPLPTK